MRILVELVCKWPAAALLRFLRRSTKQPASRTANKPNPTPQRRITEDSAGPAVACLALPSMLPGDGPALACLALPSMLPGACGTRSNRGGVWRAGSGSSLQTGSHATVMCTGSILGTCRWRVVGAQQPVSSSRSRSSPRRTSRADLVKCDRQSLSLALRPTLLEIRIPTAALPPSNAASVRAMTPRTTRVGSTAPDEGRTLRRA